MSDVAKEIPETATEKSAVSYIPLYSPLTLWAAACFGSILGFSRLAYGLFLPSMRKDIIGNYSVYGLAQTANFVGYLVGTLLVPVILSRYTNRPKLAFWGLLIMNSGLILTGSSLDLWQLAFWRLVVGLTSAVATVLTLTLAVEMVRAEQRGRASGLVWSGGTLGNAIAGLIAPLVITVGEGYAWRLAWVAMGMVGLVSTFAFYHYIRPLGVKTSQSSNQGSNHTSNKVRMPEIISLLFKPGKLLLITIAYFCFGFGYIIGSTYFISLLVQQGLPPVYTGLVWAVSGVLGVFSGTFWGRMTDRYAAGGVMTTTMLLAASGTFLQVTSIIWLEIIGNILVGLCLIGPPLLVTVVLRRELSGEQYTASFSFLTAIFAVGQILGPVVGGVIADNIGLAAGIALGATVLALGGVSGLVFTLTRRK